MRPDWERNGIQLYCADCMDVLPHLSGVDAVVTDPPYGIGVNRMTLGNGKRVIERGDGNWDCAPPTQSELQAIDSCAQWRIYWGGNYFPLPPTRCWLVWDKCTGQNSFADCELAWTNLDSVVKKFVLPWVGANAKDPGSERVHPTQKPLVLMRWCLELLPLSAETICDPFMGSGTTGVAAVKLDRKFIGIEKEPKYFDIAVKRIERALSEERSSLFPVAKEIQRELI